MTHPLTLNWRGPGTPAVVRMVNGLTQDTTGLGTLPGAVVDTTNTTTLDQFAINRVVQMGHRIFAAVGNDIYKKVGAGAFTAEGQAAALAAAGINPADRGPVVVYIDPSNGPRWFQLFRGTGNRFHVIKYDFLTDSYLPIVDLGVSQGTGEQITTFVMNGDEFVGTARAGIVSYNPVTDVLTKSNGPDTNANYAVTAAKGVTYVVGPKSAVNDGLVAIFAILGGSFAELAELPLTTVQQGGSGQSSDPQAVQVLAYERDGNVWCAAPRNDTPSDTPNGWRLLEYNTTTGIVTDRTDTDLNALLRRDGGLTGGSGTDRDTLWRMHHYKVIENPFGTERIFIKVTLGSLNEGSVLFEHTAGGWTLIGSAQWPGFLAPVVNPFGDSSFFWTNGELSALLTAKVTPVSGGVRLDFRCFGDAGNANKVVRVYYSAAPGAPITQAQLSSPVGGTGGSSSLSSNDLINVDANGEGGSPTTYSVVHDTLAQGIPASANVRWFVEVNID